MAERRARWARKATVVAVVSALLALFAIASLATGTPPENASRNEVFAWVIAVLGAIAVPVAVGLMAGADELTRDAATPRAPSSPGPLAHYREAPAAECPRHPFARG